MKLEKSDWKPTKLFQVVTKKEENDRENAHNRFERFLKVEHLDAECLHIKRWANQNDEEINPTFYKIFRKGQILFPTRNPHLRRTAFASFDGICGEKTLTLEPNKELVVPEFIPFLFHSESFYAHTTSAIIGSTNPHCRWRDVAEFEFLLPPKSEQARLAELLWAMDDVIEKEKLVLERLEHSYSILIDNLFTKENDNWRKVKLAKIADINKYSLKNSHNPEYEFKYLDIAGIIEPKTIGILQTTKFKNAPSRARRITNDNSIVLSLVRPYFKAFVHLSNSKDLIASTGTAVIDVKGHHNSKFLFHQFFSSRFMKFCEDRMTGTNYPAITSNDLKDYDVLIPEDIVIENTFAEKLDKFDISIISIKSKILASQSLQKSLINQIL